MTVFHSWLLLLDSHRSVDGVTIDLSFYLLNWIKFDIKSVILESIGILKARGEYEAGRHLEQQRRAPR